MPSPSPEQAAFRTALQTTTSSILLNAVAGSGKTTTIIQNLDACPGKKALMAFNKKIADELQIRVNRLDMNTRLETKVATTHSFGFTAYKDAGYRKVQVNSGKVNFLLKDALEHEDFDSPLNRSRYMVKNLVSHAKSNGFGVESLDGSERFASIDDWGAWYDLIEHFNMEPEIEKIWGEGRLQHGIDAIIRLGQNMLKQSNQRRTMIDFDDMLYLPLLLNVEFSKYKTIFIDEAQDTNKVRRELAFRMLAPGGRLIIVGDPHQAIYGFTGADARALDNMASRANAIELPLSVCWRCDEKIIAEAQRYVKHIVSHDTEGKGLVEDIPIGEEFFDRLVPGDAILCRLNRPNVAVAIALLRRGKTPRIEGRDLGAQLLKHARLACPDLPRLDEIYYELDNYRTHQVQLLLSKEKDKQAAFLEDEVEALQLLIERCREMGQNEYHQLEAFANTLFIDDASKTNAIILSSIHKSKGLEFPRVYLLGPDDYQPFWLATMDWELEQEYNLLYVAITRAMHELIRVSGVASYLDKGLHRLPKGATMAPSAGPAPVVDLSQIKL